jgi:hypothetical protein
MASLEELELKNTRVTNEGLRVLRGLPGLRTLAIFCEPRLRTLNDAGLTYLKDLPKLERLSLTGGWASPAAVADLRARLPNCTVATDPVPGRPPAGR